MSYNSASRSYLVLPDTSARSASKFRLEHLFLSQPNLTLSRQYPSNASLCSKRSSRSCGSINSDLARTQFKDWGSFRLYQRELQTLQGRRRGWDSFRQRNMGFSHYKTWLYGFNSALLILLTIFIGLLIATLCKSRLLLFPLHLYDFSFICVYFVLTLQYLVLISGIVAVYISKRVLLYIYWLGMGLMIICDVCLGLVWVWKFDRLHESTMDYQLNLLRDNYSTNPRIQKLWDDAQRSFQCCGVRGPIDFQILSNQTLQRDNQSLSILVIDQSPLPLSCCRHPIKSQRHQGVRKCNIHSAYKKGCHVSIIKWLLYQADGLFILGYAVIFSIKVIFVVILRKEVEEMLKEIFNMRFKNVAVNSSVSVLDEVDNASSFASLAPSLSPPIVDKIETV